MKNTTLKRLDKLTKRIYHALIVFVLYSSCTDSPKDSTKIPEITTTAVTEILYNSVKSGGTITSDGGASVTARGVCWSINTSPTISDSKTNDGTGIGAFNSSITGLTSGTNYFVRAYATNSAGTAYGASISFKPVLTDIENNAYKTVTIGTQIWMAENLKTSKYSNGETVANVSDAAQWGALSSGAWSYYNNDAQFNNVYGKLYNWFAVTDSRKLCPTGWHPPTDSEWTTLETTLGGNSIAGGKLKETGTAHWTDPNTGADNSSGFTGLPGGDRRGATNAIFEVQGTFGRHWTSTEIDANSALGRDLVNAAVNVGSNQFNKGYGFSVRCVKD